MPTPTARVDQARLAKLAREAAANAHCPYSNFRVGAAVLADGKIFTGVNIENSSYGLTLCAERSALAAAISAGAKNITDIAVCCLDAKPDSGLSQLVPCGACRQWFTDLAPEARVYIDGLDQVFTVSDLMPTPFRI